MSNRLIIVNEFKGIITNCDDALFSTLAKHLNYQYGSAAQMIKELMQYNNAADPEIKSKKYPLIALFQPFKEIMGGDYYCTVKIPKIVIAVVSNSSDSTAKRYEQTFIPTLYPIYNEFINQISRWPSVVLQNPNYIPHTKMDVPGSPPPEQKSQAFNDYLDAIHIYDLELTFQANTNCKRK